MAKKKDTRSISPKNKGIQKEKHFKNEGLAALEEKILLLQQENQKLKLQMNALQKNMLSESKENWEFKNEKYDSSWTWIKKIAFVIYSAEKPLQAKNIVKNLLKIDNEFKLSANKNNKIANYLNQAVKYGRLERIKIKGDRGSYYL